MVVTESEDITQSKDISSLIQPAWQPNKFQPFSSLGRQSSIYSLTIDGYKRILFSSGKSFGSMNMDEFLTSIWNAEENQTTVTINNVNANDNNDNENGGNLQGGFNYVSAKDRTAISKQLSLPRQGSLSLPEPLCRKTAGEVWSDIHKQQQRGQGHSSSSSGDNNMQNPDSAAQQTFREMTLDDFLIKAGVVREHGTPAPLVLPSQQQQQQHYGLYTQGVNNKNPAPGSGFFSQPFLEMAEGGAGGGGSSISYLTMAQQVGAWAIGETSRMSGSVYRGDGNGGGYAPGQAIGAVGQVGPMSTDAVINGGADNAPDQVGIDLGGLRGRKRIFDGSAEKVVERSQWRMIKNRESALRSRARKQAYTVELEAELNQLIEENKELRHGLAKLESETKQQYLEDLIMETQSMSQKAKLKLRKTRRHMSCPF